ncbi:MAG: DUF523 domain-containing protein [Gammaproteobacteria bacterium]|nr:DUF523 domain-containing protein [Gammaproteobacteria bacterium]
MANDTSDRGGPASRLATVAVSECLLGRAVRWDGDDNGDVWPREAVARLFHCVGLCPEVGIGMGVPRPPIQLAGDPDAPRAVSVDDPATDHTDRLAGYARRVATTLDGVAGYVFADRSPSCGLAGVKVYDAAGRYRRVGRGVYAAAVLADRPGLPAVDAETLNCRDVLIEFAFAVVAYAGGCRGGTDMADLRATIEQRVASVARSP